MADDWDLHAVVRGCAAVTTSSAQVVTSNQECNFPATACFQDLFEPAARRENNFVQDQLHDLYKPFFQESSSRNIMFSPQSLPINSPLSVIRGLQDPPSEVVATPPPQIVKQLTQPQTQLRQIQQPFSVSNVSKASASHNSTSRSKRRKNHLKKVCHVAAENLSSDVWSWRKYGQKPIKGSPYPRGYYRCSTSKGCMARKQVERNRSDPGMFIVTYTAEHNHPMPNHRNSLAGSTRHKPAETPSSDEPNKPSCSPQMSPAASLSSAPGKLEGSRDVEEEDDDDFSVSNMALDDDFFVGLEDFTATDGGDECVSGHLPPTMEFPWLTNSATTIAGGG